MADVAIKVENLSKLYRLGQGVAYHTLRETLMDAATWPMRAVSRLRGRASSAREVEAGDGTLWALQDVSFDVKPGEVVGIIGRNGAGKSTLLKILSRITEPTRGHAEIYGRVGALLEVGTGFHPELTGRENIFLNGAILGMRRAEIRRKFDDIVAFAELDRFIDTPVKRYSSGMYTRLAFAVAAHLEPEILVVDEVLAVGDAGFQKKCLGKMQNVAQGGRTVLFVSHNMTAVQNLCDTGYFLNQGRLVSSGPIDEVVATYLASFEAEHVQDLAARTDHKGSGRIRFTDARVVAPGQGTNMVTCGADATIELRYEAEAELRNVHVSVGMMTPNGTRALYLSNEMVKGTFGVLPRRGTIVCRFGKLPLLPDHYTYNLFCTVNGDIADYVLDAGRFQVVGGDFYGTGKLPPQGYGSVVTEQQWSLA